MRSGPGCPVADAAASPGKQIAATRLAPSGSGAPKPEGPAKRKRAAAGSDAAEGSKGSRVAKSGKAAAPRAAGANGGGGRKQAAAGPAAGGKQAPADSGPCFTDQERQQFREALLSWYDHNHRVMPWRRTPYSKKGGGAAGAAAAGASSNANADAAGGDAEAAEAAAVEASPGGGGGDGGGGPAPADLPQQQFAYWVWVSEVMLQQTQVATVRPYFRRWVAKWPTVADLAAADIETVNGVWAGLGYYRRARYLLEGARYVVEQLGGAFPPTTQELLKIPGIGPYTAAAVSSIAFGCPSACVDGNVVRVLSRLRCLGGDPTKLGATHAALAAELVDGGRPGCYNQALMELGATVCRPVNPDCAACPVRPTGVCRAAAEWEAFLAAGGSPDLEDVPRVTRFPGRKAVKGKREQVVAVTVLEVICTSQQQQQQQPQQQTQQPQSHTGAPETRAAGAAKAAAAAAPPPAKRQRTMQDFAIAAAARKQQQQRQVEAAAAPSAGGEEGTDCGVRDSARAPGPDIEALVARGARHYLVVMRPKDGLLAGLWEFPGAVVQDVAPGQGSAGPDEDGDRDDDGEDEHVGGGSTAPGKKTPAAATAAAAAAAAAAAPTSAAARRAAADALLRKLLGQLGAGLAAEVTEAAAESAAAPPLPPSAPHPQSRFRVLGRHECGTYVHVFSHIRQTNYVTRVTALFDGDVDALRRATGAAADANAGGAAAGTADRGAKVETEPSAPRRFSGRKAGNAGAGGAAADAADDEGGRRGVADAEDDAVDDDTSDVVVVQSSSESEDGARRAVKGRTLGAVGSGKGRGRGGAAKAQGAACAGDGDAGGAGSPPSLMWATRQQIERQGLGLSSGVRKIFQLALGGTAAAAAGGGSGAKGAAKKSNTSGGDGGGGAQSGKKGKGNSENGGGGGEGAGRGKAAGGGGSGRGAKSAK